MNLSALTTSNLTAAVAVAAGLFIAAVGLGDLIQLLAGLLLSPTKGAGLVPVTID